MFLGSGGMWSYELRVQSEELKMERVDDDVILVA
jgi:hypothetical protein